jgi:hypothetical protein
VAARFSERTCALIGDHLPKPDLGERTLMLIGKGCGRGMMPLVKVWSGRLWTAQL